MHACATDSGPRPLFSSADESAFMVAVGRRWPYHGQVGNPSIGVLAMTIARSAAEVVSEHVALELECMDRLYMNAYVPLLQSGAGASHFFREIRG